MENTQTSKKKKSQSAKVICVCFALVLLIILIGLLIGGISYIAEPKVLAALESQAVEANEPNEWIIFGADLPPALLTLTTDENIDSSITLECEYKITIEEPNHLVVEFWGEDSTVWPCFVDDIEIQLHWHLVITRPYIIEANEPERLVIDLGE